MGRRKKQRPLLVQFFTWIYKGIRKLMVSEIYLVRSERNGMIFGCFFDLEKAIKYANGQKNMWIQTLKII